MLDCRWLGHGGAGRVTELLLTELRENPPRSYRWLLWGDREALRRLVFEGAVLAPWQGDPARLAGQSDVLRIPRADVSVYLHQVRPLRPGRAVTFVYDTIPLRVETRSAVRLAKRFFLQTVCALSGAIVTISGESKDAIRRDLKVPGSKIIRVTLSVDALRVTRIRALREVVDRSETVIYVGRFGAHKNLRRLCHAFGKTQFKTRGGRLVLVGGSTDEVARMTAWIVEQEISAIDVFGFVPEPELDRLIASSRALVQPSLEEGYGLPAVEAAAVGLQVAASRTGFAPEIPTELVTFLDPRDEGSLASAIDVAVSRPDADVVFLPRSTLRQGLMKAIAAALDRATRGVENASA
jgi:glycosyltransferase involved in cell wall biosynthesis